jgi:outer membrane protein OmpA-like peptidoglycan-associated protein
VTASPKPAAAASIRISFGHDQSDLSAAGSDAIKGLIKTATASGVTGFTITAYADGAADDPSSGRRLSLARAMAARKALLDSGVPSNQITVRALGGRVGDGPPDRVDIATGNAAGTPIGSQ